MSQPRHSSKRAGRRDTDAAFLRMNINLTYLRGGLLSFQDRSEELQPSTSLEAVGMGGDVVKFDWCRNAVRAIRLAQIRGFARLLTLAGRSRVGGKLLVRARANRAARPMLDWLLAFHGTFPSIESARICAARYIQASHNHPGQVSMHAEFAEVTRESDYPVLFYLLPIASELRTVFDLGGSIGNLFFQLDRHLHFSSNLTWTVHDLPFKRDTMVEFAKSRLEKRLAFSDEFSSASGVDLFIVAGAVHFFEPKLAEMLASLEHLPKHVIVNRSPFSNLNDIIAVHDGGQWVNPCKLHSVGAFCSAMSELGYELIAGWPVHERRTRVPLFPDCDGIYRGFYFRLNEIVSRPQVASQ
jgi:putative methyltransferase (TIGR04325 family)